MLRVEVRPDSGPHTEAGRRGTDLVPAGEHRFNGAAPDANGRLWAEREIVHELEVADGRAIEFEMHSDDGIVRARARRLSP